MKPPAFRRLRRSILAATLTLTLGVAPRAPFAQTATAPAPAPAATLVAAATPAPTVPIAADALTTKLDALLETSPVARRTFVGVVVAEADSGKVLYDRYGDHFFTPASNVKLYTSARALALWGAEHRFSTELAATDSVENGVVRGNLILRGRGDPILKTPDLKAIADRVVREFDLLSVEGDLVVDLSLFDPELKGPGWMWDDDPDEYQMSVTALMLDYNVMGVSARPDPASPDGVRVTYTPASTYPPYVVRPAEKGSLLIDRRPFTDTILIEGAGSPAARPVQRTLTMHDPGPWIATVFAKMLQARGVELHGAVRAVTTPIEGETLFTYETAPMPEVLALFNKPSENAIGEMLIHDFAVAAGKTPATWADGAAELGDWLVETVGLARGDFRLVDGSGLSRYDLVTPAGTVKLLRHMWQRPDREVYLQSLPVAGVDGTTGGRMSESAASGRIVAKTGTMSGVSCLSGYVMREGAPTLVFSILTNGYVGSSGPSRGLQDAICAILASSDN